MTGRVILKAASHRRPPKGLPTAVSFVGVTNQGTTTGSTSSVTLALPAGSGLGDLAYICGNIASGAVSTCSLSSSGWTLLFSAVNASSTGQFWLWSKTLTLADTTSGIGTFDLSVAKQASVSVTVLRGAADATSTLSTLTNRTTTLITPAVTPVTTNDLLLWFVTGASIGADTTRSFAPPAGVTELTERWTNPAATTRISTAVYSKQLSGGAGVSSGTMTLDITSSSGNTHAFAVAVAVRPIIADLPAVIIPPEIPAKPFYAHLPFLKADSSSVAQSDWLGMLQSRMAAGWASGLAVYSSSTFVWNSTWATFFAAFPTGVDMFMMPVDPAGAAAFCSNLNAAQRAKIRWSNGQEREGNDNTTALRAAFKARSVALWNEIHNAGYGWVSDNPAIPNSPGTGVRCCVEMDGYVTYSGVSGGLAAQIEMIDATKVDFIGWSCYSPKGGLIVLSLINSVAAAMASTWPGMRWGCVAGGINVVSGTPLGNALRVTRADNSDQWFQRLVSKSSDTFCWYDVWHFSTGDYGVDPSSDPATHGVDPLLLAVILKYAGTA